MIDFTLAEILTGLDLDDEPPEVKPASKPDEASVEKDEAKADRPKR